MKPHTAGAAEAPFTISTANLDVLGAHPRVKNRKIDKDHVESLFQSIKKVGLDMPLFTYGGEKDGDQMKSGEGKVLANFLIAGFHRREALRRLKKEEPKRFTELFPNGEVPIRRYFGGVDDMLLLQLRENVGRKDPDTSELLPHITALRDEYKMKNVSIARAIGKSESWVSQILSIGDELGDEANEAIEKNEVGATELIKAAAAAKKAKREGKPLSSDEKKAKVSEAKEKTAKRRSQGKSRAEKRLGSATLYGRYLALPKSVAMGRKLTILEETLKYLAKQSDAIPAELQRDENAVSHKKAA